MRSSCESHQLIKSKNWQPPGDEELPNLDITYLTPGARGISKRQEAKAPEQIMQESVPDPGFVPESSGAIR